MPLTDEILKKLARVTQDFILTVKSPEPPSVFTSQVLKSTLEINSKPLETNYSNTHT